MCKKDIRKIEEHLKNILTEDRYTHTLGVAYTSASMAMAYEGDMEQSYVAGLLHDCAKCIDNDKKISMCLKYNITITETEYKNPFLLHAKLGGFLAMKKYGINDKEIVSSILNHTTGRPDMSLLEKIIFVADYIEPNRSQAPNLTAIRKLAFENIDKAVFLILEDILKYLQTMPCEIDPMTQKTYDYYKKELVWKSNLLHKSCARNEKLLVPKKGMVITMKISKEMAKLAIKALEDKKAEEIRVIDISNVSVIADYFIIAHGTNRNQVQAMVDNVDETLGRAGYGTPKVEGYDTGNWALMDYKDIIVHVFDQENRTFYNLERIWRDGKQVSVDQLDWVL